MSQPDETQARTEAFAKFMDDALAAASEAQADPEGEPVRRDLGLGVRGAPPPPDAATTFAKVIRDALE